MKIPKLDKWDTIRVQWVDSLHEGGWRHSGEREKEWDDIDLHHQTIGYFFFETSKAIAVVQSIGIPFKDSSHRNTDALMVIPKVAITKVERL